MLSANVQKETRGAPCGLLHFPLLTGKIGLKPPYRKGEGHDYRLFWRRLNCKTNSTRINKRNGWRSFHAGKSFWSSRFIEKHPGHILTSSGSTCAKNDFILMRFQAFSQGKKTMKVSLRLENKEKGASYLSAALGTIFWNVSSGKKCGFKCFYRAFVFKSFRTGSDFFFLFS